MKRRVLFRADASKTVGYGHFIRSLALADYLKDDFDCYFATFNSDTEDKFPTSLQFQQITEICNHIPIYALTLEEYNTRFLEEVQSSDIVVLDNYYFTTEYQQKIKDSGCKLVCIDDVHNRHMVCDLLITVCPLRRDMFSLESNARFLGGIEYGLLRDVFFNDPPERNIQGEVKRIVLAMGGADAFNLTDKITTIVHEIFSNAAIDVIAGDTVSVSDDTCRIASIHRNLAADQIVSLMDSADIGVFPASTVCIEAFSRRLPVIAGYYVDNQKEFYDYGVKHNYFAALDCLLDEEDALKSRLEKIKATSRPCPNRIDFNFRREEIKNCFIELSKS